MQEELKVIMDLMADLQEKMEYGEEDFSERLGRKKPASVEIMKVGVGKPEDMIEEMGEEGEEEEMSDDMFEEDMSPEEKLKQRILKMRK